MRDPAELFIAAAVRPLEDDAELQLSAAQELRAQVAAHPGNEASLNAIATAMERRQPRWKWLYGPALAATALSLLPLAFDYPQLRVAGRSLFPLGSLLSLNLPRLVPGGAGDEAAELLGNPPPADCLQLFGEPGKPYDPARNKILWDQEPADPSRFADYALTYIEETRRLPPDFIATADRLDPGNSWFRYLAAATLAQGTVRNLDYQTSYRQRKDPLTRHFHVDDNTRLSQALRLFEEADRLPRYRSYRAEIALKVAAALPAGEDWLGRRASSAYLTDRLAMGPSFSDLAKAISHQAESRMMDGDKEGLRSLIIAWERFGYRALAEAKSDRAEVVGAIGAVKTTLPHFLRGAEVLEIEPERTKLQQLKVAIGADVRVREDLLVAGLGRAEAGQAARNALGNYALSVGFNPELSKADLKPGRLLEHDCFTRMSSTIGCLVMGFMALLTLPAAAMKGGWLRRLSFCLQRGLQPADSFWMTAAAVGPILLYEGVNFANPWGGRSRTLEIGPQGFQFLAAVGLSILLTAQVARFRLATTYRSLGWRPPFRLGWAFPLIAVLLWLSSCLDLLGDDIRLRLLMLVGLGILLLLVPLLLGGGRKELPWTTLARAIRPAYAAAALVLALSAFLHHGLERYWTARDRIAVVEPGIPASSALDFQAARHLQQKFLQLCGQTFHPEAVSPPSPEALDGR